MSDSIIEVSKPEFIWPGKYNQDGSRGVIKRLNLPFQVIETINESRATRDKAAQKSPDLFDYQDFPEDVSDKGGGVEWKNSLIWGDNQLVMDSLLESFSGRIDLIYIDPPFATGEDFSVKSRIGSSNESITKEQSILEEKAYRDTWGRGISSYIEMMYQRLILMKELLSERGSIYVHCDFRANSYLRLVMDEIFGQDKFRNELIWCYEKPRPAKTVWRRNHDCILFYTKSDNYVFNVQRVPTKDGCMKMRKPFKRPDGTVWKPKAPGKDASSWWIDIPSYATSMSAPERTDYPTQKPLKLVERIIKASTEEGNIVADFFCGSGTTAVAAENLKRRWIACDLGRWGIHTSRKQLLEIEGCKPFQLLNLGKYERQHWQGATFGDDSDASENTYLHYLSFILKLYGAKPLRGMKDLHGRKGDSMVHVGAVDAPVTINQVNQAVDECVRQNQKKLHVLGWEWEMGLNNLVINDAKSKGVKLSLFAIPREVMEEQAIDRGDVSFFELAYLDATVEKLSEQLSVQVKLKSFTVPTAHSNAKQVDGVITNWSDYIDYWAVDWNFQNDTFMQGWVAYRTKKQRELTTTSGKNTYPKPGTYNVLIKVVDIFGNDTSKMISTKVKKK